MSESDKREQSDQLTRETMDLVTIMVRDLTLTKIRKQMAVEMLRQCESFLRDQPGDQAKVLLKEIQEYLYHE